MCACVCVVIPFFLDVRFVDVVVVTSRGHTDRRKVTHDLFTFLPAVLALIFLVRRIQPLLSLVDHEVEFYVLTI